MGIVDDIQRDFDGVFGMKAGARRVACQRKDRADLDNLVLRRGRARQHARDSGGASEPEEVSQLHLTASEKFPDDVLISSCGVSSARYRLLLRLLLNRRACCAARGVRFCWAQHCM